MARNHHLAASCSFHDIVAPFFCPFHLRCLRYLFVSTPPSERCMTKADPPFLFIYHNDMAASRHGEFKRRFSSVQSTMTRPVRRPLSRSILRLSTAA